MAIEHKVKIDNDTTITITEPDGVQASLVISTTRMARDEDDYDEIERVNRWIVNKCIKASEYEKLNTVGQLTALNALHAMCTGIYNPK